MSRSLNLALIPGDGIGTEVVAEAIKVLDAIAPAAGLDVRTTEYDLGARRYNQTGELLPDEVVEELRGYDAILVSDAHTTEDLSAWGAPPPDQVIVHTNIYWSHQSAPGRTAGTVTTEEADLVG